MADWAWFVAGLTTGFIFLGFLFSLFFKHMNLIRVQYTLVWRNGESKKVLNTFTRLYWKNASADVDVRKLLNECEMIRSDYIGGESTFLLSLIDENFEIDYHQVYLESKKDSVKPV